MENSNSEEFVKSALVDKANVDVNLTRKLTGKVLMLENAINSSLSNPVNQSPFKSVITSANSSTTKARRGPRRKRKFATGLVCKEVSKCFHSRDIVRSLGIRYEDMNGLNQLWTEYIYDLLQIKSAR